MRSVITLAIAFVLPFAVSARGQDMAKVEPVLTGLDNPTSVIVQPETGHVFVSDSGGHQIVRMDPAAPGKATPVITDFPTDVYGKGPMYNIGPLGLAFNGKGTLIVGGGEMKDGEEVIRIFDVPEPGKTVKFDAQKQKLGPLPQMDKLLPEGNFYALAITPTALYATSNGDDENGWVLRSEIKDGKYGNLERWLATKVATKVDAPVGIAINRKGHVVVGQMGEITKPKDSLLTFYSPRSKNMLMNLETGLYDIAGLAYHPKTGLLYAVDFAWMKEDEGGLFRLDADEVKEGDKTVTKIKLVKVVAINKPTSLAFAADGTLYVTAFDKPKEGTTEKSGKLLKITTAKDPL